MTFYFNTPWLDELVLISLAFILLKIYWFTTARHDHWIKRGIAFVKPLPFFGNLKDVVFLKSSRGEVMKDLYNKLEGEPFGGVFFFSNPILIVRDPELIKSILVKDFSHFQNRISRRPGSKPEPLTQHIALLNGPKWRSLRTKLTPTFTSGKLKNMVDAMTECSLEMKTRLQESADNSSIIEVKDMAGNFTTQVIGSVIFGLQFNSIKNPDSEFRRVGRELVDPSNKRAAVMMMNNVFPKLVKMLGLSLQSKETVSFFYRVVKDTVQYREKNGVTRNDFLQLLIQLKNNVKLVDDRSKEDEHLRHQIDLGDNKAEQFELTETLMTDQCFVFFLAGFETSSTTMSFVLYELAVNPDIQERLGAEIDEVLEKHKGKITYDAIHEMSYLDKVVNETLRIHPPSPNLTRTCTDSYNVPGTKYTIQKGDVIIIPSVGLHHDPKYFPNPDKFDPERFSEENKNLRPKYAYLPFGEGPRICIGMRFGLMQAKVGLVGLLSRYKFSVCEKTTIPMVYDPVALFMTAKNGVHLTISNRK
uniref:Cytochrome P450 n=1 Tax=Timema monikensis TaxID=170555 RepID=A0A7R9HUC1_9NEOP|nr:unnamed protein product [Timema monikensis]